MTRSIVIMGTTAIAFTTPAAGQDMPGMAMPSNLPRAEQEALPMATTSTAGAPRYTYGSGTSHLPGAEGTMPGIHQQIGAWMLMAHGYVWSTYTYQPGPRGDSMAFATSMAMLTGDRELGGAHLQLRSMLSLDPLIGKRGYPNLLATGESADSAPLIDRQHPHDLFVELAARIDIPLGDSNSSLFLYGGPVAEPALGPSAFMDRASARYEPLAPITHHWFDSTHISYGVVTAGWSSPTFQLESSAFRGREPGENRWNIETPTLDSWSVRATWTPTPHWAIELSHARLKAPEPGHPEIDEARTISSVSYARRGLAATAGFSVKTRLPGRKLTAWFAEANWDISRRHTLFGRIENVANDELFAIPTDPRHDQPYRLTRATLGYAWRVPIGSFDLALGGAVDTYDKPVALESAYGRKLLGYTLFAKLSLDH